MVTRARSQTIESGDIFFFYRPRVEAERVQGREDVERFYMVLAPECPRKLFRMFVLGRKRMPEVRPGIQHPEERNWALNVLTTEDPGDVQSALVALEYETETRGPRHVAAALPVGEGKYELLRHGDHTEIAYALELPRHVGSAQEAFGLAPEASYVVSIKNPDLSVPGAPSAQEPPDYPARLKERFGERRWLDVDDPALLDYENVQLLLIGAHAQDVEATLGIQLEEEAETIASAEVCRRLRLRCDQERVTPLLTGEFPERVEPGPRVGEVRWLAPEESPSKAGKVGGRAAARQAPSAAAMTQLLAGIDFPKSRAALVGYARQHPDRLENPDVALEVLRRLPERAYASMADVMAALGEVR